MLSSFASLCSTLSRAHRVSPLALPSLSSTAQIARMHVVPSYSTLFPRSAATLPCVPATIPSLPPYILSSSSLARLHDATAQVSTPGKLPRLAHLPRERTASRPTAKSDPTSCRRNPSRSRSARAETVQDGGYVMQGTHRRCLTCRQTREWYWRVVIRPQ
ncbi:hypothetical protein NUW54_g2463 [Trametes sanguinea]|uniref:Uncharacterized protein n=1 Tax=Trametes sanguinea TaxID=158606 RepID=A0ACC1Q792_9APHY|nr:hypothetical protein NUW54_g2463 [Trametes sanguinea]